MSVGYDLAGLKTPRVQRAFVMYAGAVAVPLIVIEAS
jgi:xanthine/uracil permease